MTKKRFQPILTPIEEVVDLVAGVARANKTHRPYIARWAARWRQSFSQLSWPAQEWLRNYLQYQFIDIVETDDEEEQNRRCDLVGRHRNEINDEDLALLVVEKQKILLFLKASPHELMTIAAIAECVTSRRHRKAKHNIAEIAARLMHELLRFPLTV